MKQFIYADNAATTKMDADAFEAMKPFLLDEFGNASQPYSFSRAAKKALKEARETIANCIGALPEEAIGVDDKYAEGTIRISFGKDNSEEEAIAIAESIAKIVNR